MKAIHLITILLFLQSTIDAQQIIWKHEIESGDDQHTWPYSFWANDGGEGFYFISKKKPEAHYLNKPAYSLLKLDKDGKEIITVHPKSLKAHSPLLPFGEKYLFSTTTNCLTGKGDESLTCVYDYEGNLLITEESFPSRYFSRVFNNKDFVFFSKPNDSYEYSYFTMGILNENFKMDSDTVSLAGLEKENLGIINAFHTPALSTNGVWSVPFSYGPISKSGGIRVDHGSIFGVKNNKVIWKFPEKINYQKLIDQASYQNTFGVIMTICIGKGPVNFTLLDDNGKILKETSFTPADHMITDMKIADNTIILLAASQIMFYTFDGQLTNTIDLKSKGITRSRHMQLLNDDSIIITVQNKKNAVIYKIYISEILNFNSNTKSDNQKNKSKIHKHISKKLERT